MQHPSHLHLSLRTAYSTRIDLSLLDRAIYVPLRLRHGGTGYMNTPMIW